MISQEKVPTVGFSVDILNRVLFSLRELRDDVTDPNTVVDVDGTPTTYDTTV